MKIQHFALAIGIAIASVSATTQQAGAVVQTQAQACGASLRAVYAAQNDYELLVSANESLFTLYVLTGIDLAGFGNAQAKIDAAVDIAQLPCA